MCSPTTARGLLVGVLTSLFALMSGCAASPRQLGGYVVLDPDGMSERMATLCYWGFHDCGGDVASPSWAAVPTRSDSLPRGRVGDETPTVEQGD